MLASAPLLVLHISAFILRLAIPLDLVVQEVLKRASGFHLHLNMTHLFPLALNHLPWLTFQQTFLGDTFGLVMCENSMGSCEVQFPEGRYSEG